MLQILRGHLAYFNPNWHGGGWAQNAPLPYIADSAQNVIFVNPNTS